MKPNLFLLFPALLLLASCSKQYYAPALLNNDIAYLPKPASFDSTKSALYVSGGIGASQGANIDDDITFGTLEVSGGHAFKNTNLAYGVFGSAGAAYGSQSTSGNATTSADLGTRGFYAAGGRLSGNLFKEIGNVNFRYLGFEAVYSHEFGDYAAFRRQASGLTNYYSYTTTRLLTAGLTSEVLWHSPRHTDKEFAFRLFLGRTLTGLHPDVNIYTDDNTHTLQTIYGAISYYMQIRHVFGVAEFSGTPSDLYWLPAIRLRLGYRF